MHFIAKVLEFVLKMTGFTLKVMCFIPKMTGFILKMMRFILKMMGRYQVLVSWWSPWKKGQRTLTSAFLYMEMMIFALNTMILC